ncbi:MAG: helix-turn-helix domain-containing protein [Clostridia bacterium]|nr:helix-turn-helix domain-containing protein [Clostridia bacterium]
MRTLSDGEDENVNHYKCFENGENPPENISLGEILSSLPKDKREQLTSGYDLKNLAKIFEDSDVMMAVDGFLENGMNISLAARKLYMHRNTLIYRLNKVRALTGLDLKNFDMALTFKILRALYELK